MSAKLKDLENEPYHTWRSALLVISIIQGKSTTREPIVFLLTDFVTPQLMASHLKTTRLTAAVKFTAKVERIFSPEITKSEILTDGTAEIFSTCKPREIGTSATQPPLRSVHSHNWSGGEV